MKKKVDPAFGKFNKIYSEKPLYQLHCPSSLECHILQSLIFYIVGYVEVKTWSVEHKCNSLYYVKNDCYM